MQTLQLQEANKKIQYHQVQLDLIGRFMLADKNEFPCKVKNISPGEVVLLTHVKVAEDERIVAYIDQLGRIEGTVKQILDNGFLASISATTRKREKIAAQLTWLINHENLDLPDERNQTRLIPNRKDIDLKFDDGQTHACKIIDISIGGAALSTDIRPDIGTHLTLGKMSAYVIRHFENGIAVKFEVEQDTNEIVSQARKDHDKLRDDMLSKKTA